VIILSLDAPGTRLGAYAVCECEIGTKRVPDHVLEFRCIEFGVEKSEREELAALAHLLDQLYKTYHPALLVVEHPFLHVIAQFIGSVKMWACRKRGLRWYMINPSQAQKLVFGAALRKKRMTKTGRVVSDSRWKKEQVVQYVRREFHLPKSLSQHEADAIFYAIAVGEKLRSGDALASRT